MLYPTSAYGSLPQLSTSDSQVFTFGTDDNGYAIAPIGKVGIYATAADIPDYPWREGQDFVRAGATAIRIPNNGTYTGTAPYWIGITPPSDIDATHQPALFPESARELIPIRAAYAFGLEGMRNPDLAAAMAAMYGEPVAPPGVKGRFAYWCTTWKTQFKHGGALMVSGRTVALSEQS